MKQLRDYIVNYEVMSDAKYDGAVETMSDSAEHAILIVMRYLRAEYFVNDNRIKITGIKKKET